MALVYAHLKKDTREIFYIGIGLAEKRAHWQHQRSKMWTNTVKKHGYIVDILINNISWEMACSIEKYLISFYGRQDLKAGQLVNMTDGGDGAPNIVVSEETRKKQSMARKGKSTRTGAVLSEETRRKISESNKGKVLSAESIAKGKQTRAAGNHPPPMLGKKQTEEGKRKISLSLIGKPSRSKGHKKSDESKKKISEKMSGANHPCYGLRGPDNPHYGTRRSQEFKDNLSRQRIGVKRGPMSEAQKKLISIGCMGHRMPVEAIAAGALKRQKPVLQYSVDGSLIKEWPSLNSICEAYGGHRSNLRKAIRGNIKYKHFFWRDKI